MGSACFPDAILDSQLKLKEENSASSSLGSNENRKLWDMNKVVLANISNCKQGIKYYANQ